MQSRLLGAMRRLVYVADKVAVKEATIAERNAYVNRLEQQLVTKAGPTKRPPCKGHTEAFKTGRRRPNGRCQSGGPDARSASPSTAARRQQTLLTTAPHQAPERRIVTSTLAAAPGKCSRRPASTQAHAEVSGYRQKHEMQSQARLVRQAGPQVTASLASLHAAADGTQLRSPTGRLDANSLVAGASVEPSIIAGAGATSPHSDFTGLPCVVLLASHA